MGSKYAIQLVPMGEIHEVDYVILDGDREVVTLHNQDDAMNVARALGLEYTKAYEEGNDVGYERGHDDGYELAQP